MTNDSLLNFGDSDKVISPSIRSSPGRFISIIDGATAAQSARLRGSFPREKWPMKVGRRFWLVIAWRSARSAVGRPARARCPCIPVRSSTPGTLDVETFIAEHNRNAESIQSLEAKPSIKVASPARHQVPVDGRMALERPRNFRLELSSLGTTKADIGSNDDEFWFWVSNRDDPSIYWCKYADLESSPWP